MRKVRAILPFTAALAASCITLFHRVQVDPVAPTEGTAVATQARVHLLDGSTVMFPAGFRIEGGVLTGAGTRYSLQLGAGVPVSRLPLDSVAGVESYSRTVLAAPSTIVSLAGTAGVVAGAGLLAVAIFGSCPTLYADSAGTLALEAESFSYSIAPVLESRDVDRLRVQPDPDGIVRVEVRNEALETHFINQLGALDVRHRPDEVVAPDPAGRPVALAGLTRLSGVRDRRGVDWSAALAAADGRVTQSSDAPRAASSDADLRDYLEFELAVPAGADSVALYLRARNSLLTTVLFYDVMLGRQGARAVTWLEDDLNDVGRLAALADWAIAALGLHVQVFEAGEWQEVARVGDPGPIAWKDIAVLLPTNGRSTLRIRLESLVDAWRIDRLAAAATWRRPPVAPLVARRVVGPGGRDDARALTAVREPDDRYLETHPGDRFVVEFPVPPLGADEARTVLAVAQGYYIEWIRPSWLVGAAAPVPFEPGRSALVEAVRRWRQDREGLEQRFYSTRLPVR